MKLPTNVVPLLDGDWLVYLACNAVEYKWEGEDSPPFHEVISALEWKLDEIINILDTTATPIFFFTGANNFRKELAVSKVYKGTRTKEKPYHFHNIATYIKAKWPYYVEDNLEADDLMAIHQTIAEGYNEEAVACTCIVTVDKDLRQVEGWHYSPEGWNYGSFGPTFVTEENSYIELKKNKVVGTGWKFFYSQLLTGDGVDNIPGCPGIGPKKAYNILANVTTKGEAYDAVYEAYKDAVMIADECLEEQANLLWMVRELNEDGSPILWEKPDD